MTVDLDVVRDLLKRLDASELPQPDCVLLGQLADEFERLKRIMRDEK